MADDTQSVMLDREGTLTMRGKVVKVQDPSLRKILKTASSFKPLLDKFQESTSESNVEVFLEVIQDDTMFEAFKLCASACTDQPPEFFNDIGIAETLALVNKLKEVVNWNSLSKLLFQLAEQGKKVTTSTMT